MNIEILGPDINEGFSEFSVSDGKIRFGMSAIKGIGEAVIEKIVEERQRNGRFLSMEDFMKRLTSKEVNKSTIENFIKSGAFDCLEGNRQQKMIVYPSLLEQIHREKKDNLEGQLSLFDMGDAELEQANRITYPPLPEYEKEEYLMYEKEVMGIYVSGHPLEEYLSLMEKNCTHNSMDFLPVSEEEMGMTKVDDGETVIVGGMISSKTTKITKTNSMMAFLTIEDIYGTVEVVVFPREYEKYKEVLLQDSKVFVKGRVDFEEERASKILCKKIIPFEQLPCELWIRFENRKIFEEKEQELYQQLLSYDGNDEVCIYVKEEKQVKRLPVSRNVNGRKVYADGVLDYLGKDSVAIREKSIEK